MISLLVASLMIPYSVLADDCAIVRNAWKAMGKPASTDCCTMTGITCSGSSVTQIDWSAQGLKGQIPDSLGNLDQLTKLWLNNNQLSGQIPTSLRNLKKLDWLSLGSNKLTGRIPSSLGELTQLTRLGLGNNQFSGPIPSTFGNLTQLISLNLMINDLDGPIPDLGKLDQLEKLWLQGNQLSGPIPSTFSNLRKLKELWLFSNQLTGPIPSFVGTLTELTTLFLSKNKFIGPIPATLGDLNQLTKLTLNDNQLTGVPSSLSKLVNCEIIVLLPNPILNPIPYDIQVKNPVSTMTEKKLRDFLNTAKMVKRQSSSTLATLTTDQLLATCPLNKVENKDILAGCVAGIVYFCQGQMDLTQCQRYYNTVFTNSIFAPIGASCPAWKSGPRSQECKNAVNSINFDLEYTTVNKEFAKFFANTLFADKVYAPCNNNCKW